MKRTVIPELLDMDAGTAAEIADSLADLRWFNRYFGGYATTTALLRSIWNKLGRPKQISYLDVAGATSDAIQHTEQQLPGVIISATVLDRSPKHLASGVTGICGDALTLPFRDASFDIVGCSLFLHHLEREEIGRFTREALRVARHAFLINDLVRSRMHHLAAVSGRLLYRSRLTRHDAPASVQRAYTHTELREILTRSGYLNIEMSSHYFYRMGVIIWR